MNMDQTQRRHDDGRKVYVVGPVERWIIGLVAIAVVAACARLISQMDSVQSTALRIELSQAVTNSELTELKAKQALMQMEVSKIPRIEVQVQNNTEQLREQNRVRNLK